MSIDNSSANKRIAKNSIALSIRLVIVLCISLFTTRVLLNALGVEDYGIYNVVGGFVTTLAFLNNALTSATQRFYNYELGANGDDGIRKIYNIAVYVHCLLGIIIVILTEILGIWYLNHKIVVPSDRLFAAQCIFQFCTVSLFLNVINVPYQSAIMAYEKMDVYAIVGVLDAVLKLVIALTIPFVPYDHLITYGFLFMCVSFLNFTIYNLYARKHFKSLKLGLRPEKRLFVDMLRYSGWNLFGSFAYMAREQGVNLILNAYFGPVVNAARGVANQVNGALDGFVNNLTVPTVPQIIQSYASGDESRSFNLAFSISKLSFIFYFTLALPIIINIDWILHVWLGNNIPDHTASFLRIILVMGSFRTLLPPMSNVVHATGKMMFYQFTVSTSNLMTIPIALAFLCYREIPEFVFYALFITMILAHVSCLLTLKKYTSFSFLVYLKRVLLPLLLLFTICVPIGMILSNYLENDIISCIVSTIVLVSVSILISYCCCLSKQEKEVIMVLIKRFRR